MIKDCEWEDMREDLIRDTEFMHRAWSCYENTDWDYLDGKGNRIKILQNTLAMQGAVLNMLPECPKHGANCLIYKYRWIKAKLEESE